MEFRTFHTRWGAEFISSDVVRFRVWAEGQQDLTLRLTETDIPMVATGHGWFQVDVPDVKHGTAYQFVLQDGMAIPDPLREPRKGMLTDLPLSSIRGVILTLILTGKDARGKRR